MLICQHPSPNFGQRRGDAPPSLVVIHYTAMATAQDALSRLCDPTTEVSAHYVICEEGQVYQLVNETQRAWHAGAGAWGDITDVNSHSIGIELANRGPDSEAPQFPKPQMVSLITLLQGIVQRWALTPERVIGHSDMAPGRKVDPGPYFNWQTLAKAGLSVWPASDQDADPSLFQGACTTFGFRAPDENWDIVRDAFRLRFNPLGQGPITRTEAGLAVDLARRWPFQRA